MSLDSIFALFDVRGQESYGESITQLEHALQCGQCAERDGADAELITAAVLHDVGHLLHRDTAAAYAAGTDDCHETIAAKYLARYFAPWVTEPVRLHVAAKRYLCHVEPGYFDELSETSRLSLGLQGGPMSAAEAEVFAAGPHAEAAVRLRRWDDEGKVPGLATPPLDHYRRIAERCALSGAR